jgi:hypothetical protein
MEQAAAQAQAVIAATKALGDLVPMNATEIYALSQKQANAIVNAWQETSTTTLPEAEVKAQIQVQAQALVHAHTQAQNALNINMGDVSKAGATSKSGTAAKETTASTTTPEVTIEWQAEHYSTVTGAMAASKSNSQIASKPSTQCQKRYNQLLPQKFECSDLLREFFKDEVFTHAAIAISSVYLI